MNTLSNEGILKLKQKLVSWVLEVEIIFHSVIIGMMMGLLCLSFSLWHEGHENHRLRSKEAEPRCYTTVEALAVYHGLML